MTLQAPYSDGAISQPMDLLKQVIGATPLFPTLFPDAATKKTFYINAISRPAGSEAQNVSELRPLIMLTPDQPVGMTKRLAAASGYFVASGSITVLIEKDIADLETLFPDETTNDEEILRVWDNLVDEFTNQLIRSAYGEFDPDVRMDVSRVHSLQAGRSSESDRAKHGEFVGATFKVDWGPEQ